MALNVKAVENLSICGQISNGTANFENDQIGLKRKNMESNKLSLRRNFGLIQDVFADTASSINM